MVNPISTKKLGDLTFNTKTHWRTKDGTVVRIRDMTDSHIINTIRMLIRQVEAGLDESLSHPPAFQGEMAQFYAEEDYLRLCGTNPEEEAEDMYPGLFAEAERRKLKWSK